MKPIVIKGIAGTLGASGLVVGGYYGIEALSNEHIPVIIRNTIEKELIKEGYTIFSLNESEWQTKFESFRDGDKLEAFAKALKEFKGNSFVVAKSQANTEGGKELKNWCIALLDLEKEKQTENKTIENAKNFCAEKQTPKPNIRQGNPEPGSAG
ncbi:hypothetical protein A6V39_00345 [Candidatus Mycoplasma haematobovis]|uniref:Uncharacterized protein n=1 Tax=Candidatus Mycoplasma haematobovis TaxID=432608 RepID=A0A1A9QFK7_9MOLU|nr:hypothetical protein [Candidatus Mycoplasma haematobovis]OAL10499.1 hypothetical protein A6V39_00345 [Candidatus Mycoplasma haematobovis]